ncbi:hypothetical protein EI94DRAFT_1563106 [Lactarius quietus]|nr:hypothetical protein EI94DRAFT_1563106 [Lactarius quietus]
MQNYESFLSCPFSLESQPCVLIFVDKELVCHISAHLDSCHPLELCDTGVMRHYHSMMSQKYLQLTHEAFTTPTGNCHILVAISGQSVGVDFPDVKIVCTAGLPSTMVDILQHGGCTLCNSHDNVLFIILYECWIHNISLDEYTEGDLSDPDCPRAKLKMSSQRCKHAPLSCLRLVKSPTCLQAHFASYLDDTSPTGAVNSRYLSD